MATDKKTARTPRGGGTAALKTWGRRALIALVAGASIGAGAGVFTVNKLEPGRGTGVDSLAVMLDSIAPTSRRARPATRCSMRDCRWVKCSSRLHPSRRARCSPPFRSPAPTWPPTLP